MDERIFSSWISAALFSANARLSIAAMCEMNKSSRSDDSRLILQSKLSPPGARPPWLMIAKKTIVAVLGSFQFIKNSYVFVYDLLKYLFITIKN